MENRLWLGLLAKKWKCDCIDIDQIGHQATNQEEITQKLCETFGQEILGEKGIIDRKKLGNIVFSDKAKMERLTQITWEYMQEVLDERLEKENKEVVILDWALLPISKYWDKCSLKILVEADQEIRKQKVVERDHITEEYFLKRDSAGIDLSNYQYDYIFQNDYQKNTMEKFIEQIK